MNTELVIDIKKEMAIELSDNIDLNELKEKLTQHINYLIQHDFERLVAILYRIDINEKKLKELLQRYSDKDSGGIIAQLIIERQLEKIKTRQQFKTGDNISEEEKW
jgi:hypothetical protein